MQLLNIFYKYILYIYLLNLDIHMNTNIYKCIYADLDIYCICTYSGSNDNRIYGNKLDIEYPILQLMENFSRKIIIYTFLVLEQVFVLCRIYSKNNFLLCYKFCYMKSSEPWDNMWPRGRILSWAGISQTNKYKVEQAQ